MFNNLFSKIMGSYILIPILILLVLLMILPNYLEDYFIQAKESELVERSQLIARLLGQREGQLRDDDIDNLLSMAEELGDTSLLIIDGEGRIVTQGRRMMDMMSGGGYHRGRNSHSMRDRMHDHDYHDHDNHLEHHEKMAEGLEEELELILSGEELTFKGENPIFEQQMVGVAQPISTDLALFLLSPIEELQQTVIKVRNLTVQVILAAIALALILGYFISKGITRPVKNMQEKVKRMAAGDFKIKLTDLPQDEIGQLGRAFNHLAKRLEKLDEMRRLFVANASHELKTPLTAIQGYLEAILDGMVEEERVQEEYLKRVLGETKRMSRLVGDILNLSRLQSDQIEFNLEEIELVSLIKSVLVNLESKLGNKTVKVNGDKEVKIKGDYDRLREVIINLLSNAIKYTADDGQIEIQVTDQKEQVEVSVIDDGIGIPDDELPYIWERFHQVDRVRSPDSKGTGLGLAIVKEIIEGLGGKIKVESQEGVGSKFSFKLNK
ncbi:cell wall metabolism sensor histidine kinase WalK [Natroniella sulfidigena]|uniref:sensor histidine kinase n=1 Tax=Natroniella sulfidigena TaxID=723921 RepID=UPI00200B3785|nr:HAMP domain-containing sensor histidine kinase [Natroniella sulfidigena]MCK8817639.1 cell wall metabolism sensor histidine kinase WalK [Natroniella sulfidigena]